MALAEFNSCYRAYSDIINADGSSHSIILKTGLIKNLQDILHSKSI